MNTRAYDYPQTLEISKQHVHKSLCGNTDEVGGLSFYNEEGRRGQASH